MFRQKYFTFLFATALFLFSSAAAFAQTAPVFGKVELRKADGTVVPVAGALVEPFRTDAKGKPPSGKTNKKGEFNFAGLQLGQIYALSVSAPNIAPALLPNIRAGMENIVITVTEGDGKRRTEEEVRQALANPSGAASTSNTTNTAAATPQQPAAEAAPQKAELTEEQKKQQAEYESQVKEVTAKNENIKQKTAIIEASLKAGNEAFQAKNYDAAIVKYNEGIQADPNFVGSAPVLLNNKGAALKNRGVENYNKAARSTDAAMKADLMPKAKQDLQESVAVYNQSWTILKGAQPADIPNQANFDVTKLQALSGLTDAYRLMFITKADTTKTAEAKAAYSDYFAVETDAVKKSKAQISLGDIMREAGDSENAIAAYRLALESAPDDADALAGLGLSLFAAGAGSVPENKAQMQEGLNYMEKFAQVAPETHPLKASVKDAVTYLKTEQKLTPQKVNTKKKN